MRKRTLTGLFGLVAMLCWLSQAQAPHKITAAEFDQMVKDLSNWGRWGKTDEKGTINLITPAKSKAAAALVTEGFSVSLARNTDDVQSIDKLQSPSSIR